MPFRNIRIKKYLLKIEANWDCLSLTQVRCGGDWVTEDQQLDWRYPVGDILEGKEIGSEQVGQQLMRLMILFTGGKKGNKCKGWSML